MNNNPIREQAKAIQEDLGKQPQRPSETPREARHRAQREREAAERKKNPQRGY